MSGAGEKDAKAATTEERTTERRLVAASAVMQTAADSTRDVASEDFLFHLFRGSELLQDNRILEAKEELEHALTLQPRDPKGQDLLAVVYFRIGLYPRAIQIYEQLKRENPRDPSLKLNLSLCYLKTGQAQLARTELDDVVRLHPTNKRAWGYLGLALERVGELEKAVSAFERAGHPQMARRIAEKFVAAVNPGRGRTIPAGPSPETDLRGAAAPAAFHELDAGEISFSLAEPVVGGMGDAEAWRTTEPGATALPRRNLEGWTVPPTAEAVASMRAEEAVLSQRGPQLVLPPSHQSTPDTSERVTPSPSSYALAPLAELTHASRIAFPPDPGVAMHASGVALVRLASGDPTTTRPFAARLEAIRVHAGALSSEVLSRQARGKPTGDSFGGVGSPLARVSGSGEIVVAPRPSHKIVAFTIADGDLLTVREDVLLGFELGTITYDNGKLGLGDGDTAHVVQLRGAGAVLLELLERIQSLQVTEGHAALVRRDTLVGWTGRVAPRAIPPAEAPGGQRGLLALAGEGTVFLSG